MSLAQTRRDEVLARDSESSYQRFLDAIEDSEPTKVFRREPPTSGVVRVVPRDVRGPSPSSQHATWTISRMIRETRSPAASMSASDQLTTRPNVFLLAPQSSDPPAPWALARRGREHAPSSGSRPRPTRSSRSLMPLLTLAMALAIGVGLWRDAAARHDAASDISRTSARVSAFVLELALR